MKRVTIILVKRLSLGEVGNISAILMGQLARDHPALFDSQGVLDLNKCSHSAVNTSIILLKANGSGQLLNLIAAASTHKGVSIQCFSKCGQGINDNPSQYQEIVEKSQTADLEIVGVGLYGDASLVKLLSKKFSILV